MKRDRHMYINLVESKYLKYGYSKDPEKRMKQLMRVYGTKDIKLLWVSDLLVTEQTARNNEHRIRKQITQNYKLKHKPNDRFYLNGPMTISIHIRGKIREDATIFINI